MPLRPPGRHDREGTGENRAIRDEQWNLGVWGWGFSAMEKKMVAGRLRGDTGGGGGPAEAEIGEGLCGEAATGASPAAGGVGRRPGRRWLRGWSWSSWRI
jgi:hypothetical protein